MPYCKQAKMWLFKQTDLYKNQLILIQILSFLRYIIHITNQRFAF